MAALPIPPGTKRRAARTEQRHQETYWKTARSHASSLQTAEAELGVLVASYRDKHPGFLAGKECGARCLHLARCSPQTYANLKRHRATDPARTQAAHLQSQGLSKPRLVGAPLNRGPHRRKMGNRNQGIHQMGTARSASRQFPDIRLRNPQISTHKLLEPKHSDDGQPHGSSDTRPRKAYNHIPERKTLWSRLTKIRCPFHHSNGYYTASQKSQKKCESSPLFHSEVQNMMGCDHVFLDS